MEEVKVKRGTLDDLIPDDRNMNRHTSYGMSLIEKSIRKNKFGRSILVDKNGRIIGGNGVTETAMSIGETKTIVVETTGDELVVVKRTDVDLDSQQGREMALADNATAVADIDWDAEAVKEIEGEFEISPEDWGVIANEAEQYGEDFTLPDGEKSPFCTMSFIVAEEQQQIIKDAIAEAQHMEEYKYMETMGNTNTNGNALYLIMKQWADARK